MNTIKATIGERIEDFFLWNKGQFPRVVTKYIGGETGNGICYKDLEAWERGGHDDIIYISEGCLDDEDCRYQGAWTKPHLLAWVRMKCEENDIPIVEEFVEHIALRVLHECDWQDLSTMIEEIDMEENYNYFISSQSN